MKEPIRKENEGEWEYKDRYNNFMAFMTRCKIHRMDKAHGNTERFPYNTMELAIYMDHICNLMKPMDHGEEENNDHGEPEVDSKEDRKQTFDRFFEKIEEELKLFKIEKVKRTVDKLPAMDLNDPVVMSQRRDIICSQVQRLSQL